MPRANSRPRPPANKVKVAGSGTGAKEKAPGLLSPVINEPFRSPPLAEYSAIAFAEASLT
jgi:hypothetical protein